MTQPNRTLPASAPPRTLLLVWVLFFAVVLLLAYRTGLLERLAQQMEAHPRLSPLIFLLLYIATCIFLLPGGFLTPAAGLLFGLHGGILLVAAGAVSGSAAAFLIARYAGGGMVRKSLQSHPQLRRLDTAVAQSGWKIVLLSRLTPIVPFRLSNYLFGLTRVPLLVFCLATAAGVLPSATFYVYSATVARDLAAAGRHRDTAAVAWQLSGVIFSFVFLLLLIRMARKALLSAPENPPAP